MSYYTVQLQAWRLHYPISAEIGLVITSHVYIICTYKPVFKKVTIWAPILFPLEKYGRISEEELSLECKHNVCFVSPSTIAKKVFLLQCDKCWRPVHRLFDEKRKGICILYEFLNSNVFKNLWTWFLGRQFTPSLLDFLFQPFFSHEWPR